ncbi:MAG TPA: hypothetical protein VK756_00225 [Solirubrobacteraceae bacterium]|jgi:hypothetical protein|nr:hypothetical protein [Solirubrobacteraceae bacterium]
MESATLSPPPAGSAPRAHASADGSSTWRTLTWAKLAFALLCLAALVGYFAFPTYPTYDSFYALLWGRDLLHLHLPDFSVYRGPTEHPLAIAFGMLCSIFGQGGARLMVLGSIGSFVTLVAGIYRLTRLCFGALVAVLAALLMLTRLFDANLAAQGYLDLTYVALIVWATALEVQRPRRGTPVLALLALAGLLRPDAWVLAGAYWLWCVWPTLARAARGGTGAPPGAAARQGAGQEDAAGEAASAGAALSPRRLLAYTALAASAPLIWVAVDTIVTGDPLYSLHSTAVLAAELERTQGFSAVLAATWRYAVRIDKLPVVVGGIAGALLALWLTPRRARVPLVVLALLLLVYVGEGAGGASVIDRYMLGSSALLLPFCALAIGGWSLLRPGSRLRRVWMAAGAALVLYGALAAVSVTSLTNARTTLSYHDDFHEGLAAALHAPAVRAELARCPLLSLPDNKLIPDARWILDTTNQRDVVARSEARADAQQGVHTLAQRIARASVAVYPLGAAVFQEAIVDIGDDPLDQVPLPGFRRIYTSRYYAVYGNC